MTTVEAGDRADPEFVASLRTNVRGIYYKQVERWDPPKIEREFRKILPDPTLAGDEELMDNLLFLVRKREVSSLADDVRQLLARGRLPTAVEVSALKTVYALGASKDRVAVDDRMSRHLQRVSSDIASLGGSPYFEAAERVGGLKTLEVLRAALGAAVAGQREAEERTPNDHGAIERLDRVRAALDEKVYLLNRKVALGAVSDRERTRELTKLYLRKVRGLGYWAGKELVSGSPRGSADAIREVLSRELGTLVPAAIGPPEARTARERDLRLRGIGLLEGMGAELTEEERRLWAQESRLIAEREEFIRFRVDWEDVLDRR